MILFPSGKLSPAAFDDSVCRATQNLEAVLRLAAATKSASVETTHFLMAVAKVPGGVTQQGLGRRGLTPEHWCSGLESCAESSANPPRLDHLSEAALSQGAKMMLHAARERCVKACLERISEAILLRYALEHATPPVRELCRDTDIDVAAWCRELEDLIAPPPPIVVFGLQPPQEVILKAFSRSGRKVLRLLQTEAQSLGYDRADPRHLLLGLLCCEGGATLYGLHQQGAAPRKVQEAVMLNLRGRARRTRSSVGLTRQDLQPLLQHILERAGELAGRDRASTVAEAHLLQAFVTTDSAARRLLEDCKIDLVRLRKTAEDHDLASEASEDGDDTDTDIEVVRQRLRDRLVGQEQAIEQILPYLELARFGLTTPGHPVGVFLFCGQSGSGKTEMAKELARAVYGSEEKMIYLEMGQFNAPESMNIFVGAPPGYIGYGEGKLTNGLRDAPDSVVLFDEVEKAHSKVLDALLRFLDEGRIDDPAGPVRDGSRTIVVLTSNTAASELDQLRDRYKDSPNARTEIRKALREKFAQHNFRVEFLNRVDEVILFSTLREEDYIEIARRTVVAYGRDLQEQFQIEVRPDPDLAEVLGRYCAHLNEGARAVARVVRATVLLPVCRFVRSQRCGRPVRLRVRAAPASADRGAEPVGLVSLA